MDAQAIQIDFAALEIESVSLQPIEQLVREAVPLSEEDLGNLEAHGPSHCMVELKHIRAYHHVVAMKLAAGERPRDICRDMGFTPATISRLQSDPMFKELVESYRERIVQNCVDHTALMSLVSAEALSALHERLCDEDQRGEFSSESLRRLAETFVDRIGLSPVRRSENANVHRIELNSARIAQIKEINSESRRWSGEVLEITDFASAAHQADSERNGAAEGAAAVFIPAQKEVEVNANPSTGQRVREESASAPGALSVDPAEPEEVLGLD